MVPGPAEVLRENLDAQLMQQLQDVCGKYGAETDPFIKNIYLKLITRLQRRLGLADEWKEQARRDQTLEKWKERYFAIKVEVDDLIRRTREEERLCWKTEGDGDVMLEMKREVAAKGERIEFLEVKLAAMERQEVKREMDILRQSLRKEEITNRLNSGIEDACSP
ncbi:uncharacterized protein LOC121760669 [Salvia splendens]|uniref:uncharacterized protein LOC121760669 n=1 Tax=Salvia splendens TaxID=180675 RepID=UPI001C281018|nr:uncharacterized protein LOC121760669 [Salvia splendens]